MEFSSDILVTLHHAPGKILPAPHEKMSNMEISGVTPFDVPLQPLFTFAAYFSITILQTTASKFELDGAYSSLALCKFVF